ncbi:hypothetical protein [Nocardiopsis alba]|uniref:hypothetical protein n=1 Tax=Nocardiopsis alba TaxID=53437 RepID=UPI0033B431A3
MSTATAPALTMEIVLDAGPHKHLRFQRGMQAWEILTFPGGLLVRSFGDYVLVNGADNIIDSMAYTEGDPVYWASKLTSGDPRVWDEEAFRAWLAREAAECGVQEEVESEILSGRDLHSEALAREAVAAADLTEIDFPEYELDDFFVPSPHFLRALERAREGLACYAAQQS